MCGVVLLVVLVVLICVLWLLLLGVDEYFVEDMIEVMIFVICVMYFYLIGLVELCLEWFELQDSDCVQLVYDLLVGMQLQVGQCVFESIMVEFYVKVVLVILWLQDENFVGGILMNVLDRIEVCCIVCEEIVCVEVEIEGLVDEGLIWCIV